MGAYLLNDGDGIGDIDALTTMEKEILLGKTPAELQEIVTELGLPKFTAKQLVDWLYQ